MIGKSRFLIILLAAALTYFGLMTLAGSRAQDSTGGTCSGSR